METKLQIELMLETSVNKLEQQASYLKNLAESEKYAQLILQLNGNSLYKFFKTTDISLSSIYSILFKVHHAMEDDGDLCIVRTFDQNKKDFYDDFIERAKSRLPEKRKEELKNIDFFNYEIREGDWVSEAYGKDDIAAVFLTKEQLEEILGLEIAANKYLFDNKEAISKFHQVEYYTWRQLENKVVKYMKEQVC